MQRFFSMHFKFQNVLIKVTALEIFNATFFHYFNGFFFLAVCAFTTKIELKKPLKKLT